MTMRFNLAAVERAIATSVSAEVAGRIADAAKAVRHAGGADAGSISAEDLPAVLARALVPGIGAAAAEAPLLCVELSANNVTATLDAAEAVQNAFTSTWVPLTLGEAIAFPFVSAATFAALAPGQARQEIVEVVLRAPDPPRGIGFFLLNTPGGPVRATCRYGEPGVNGAHVVVHHLSGAAMAAAGWSFLAAGQTPAAVPKTPPESVADAWPPPGAAVH